MKTNPSGPEQLLVFFRIFQITCFLAAAFAHNTKVHAQPVINGIEPGHDLRWSGGQSNHAAAIEFTTDLESSIWSVYKFDLATNGIRHVSLPTNTLPSAFYRVKVINTPPDPSLVLHLTFENDIGVVNGVTNWVMVDSSGYDNHGWSYPLAGTNIHRWPSVTTGPDGGQAGDFRMYYDGYGNYGRSGDWVGIPITSSFSRLTNATIMAWARYYRENYFPDSPRYELVQLATIFNAYYQGAPWSWNLGRFYTPSTAFTVLDSSRNEIKAINFPDYASTNGGDSGGWNHYAVTFEAGTLRGIYNGVDLGQSYTIATNVLLASRYYAALGCWNFGRAPGSGPYNDGYPNAGWMYGAIDDVRIYNRVLSTQEIAAIYYSFDKQPPSTPTNLVTTSISSMQVNLSWNASTDRFGVAGYSLFRDGQLITIVTGTNATDETVLSGASYNYTVAAYDVSGNTSPPSTAVSVVIP